MPIVANVLTIIQIAAVLVLWSGAGWGFSCSAGGRSPALSTSSSPISSSSGLLRFAKAPSDEPLVVVFSLSSKVSASVVEELIDGSRSVDRSAMESVED